MYSGRLIQASVLLLGVSTVALGGGTPSITTVRVASGLSLPTFVTHAPGDFDRLYIVEKQGRIRVLNFNTGLYTTFMDINSQVGGGTTFNDERGLLGMAFHPDFATNKVFYVNYINNQDDTRVSKFVATNSDVASSATQVILLTVGQPQTNHNGGWIAFKPGTTHLYVAMGDGGNFCDTGTGHNGATGNAQDTSANLLGKMLRYDAGDGSGSLTIPADNPFVGIDGDDEIWSYGLRNPWRDSFDRLTGDLWIGDVGQGVWEEVDFQPAGSNGGENYGWRCMEGNDCSSVSGCPTTGCTCDDLSLTYPVVANSHSAGRCSVTGGYVYRGCDIPGLEGKYFHADFCSNQIFSFRYDGAIITDSVTYASGALNPPGQAISSISSFGEDAYGEMYIVDHNGEVFRIIASGAPAVDCNLNATEDDCDLLDGSSTDANENGILDECEIPPCKTVADCADQDENLIRDDACLQYECVAGKCVETLRSAGQADIGGFAGDCLIDGACDSNDGFHALNCFGNTNTLGEPPYPCEPNTPNAMNIDASGAFGDCALDGACDSNDVFSALGCFADTDTNGLPPYPCTCGGPAPQHEAASQPRAVARTPITLRAPRLVQPGGVVDVDVYLDAALQDLRGYQLHLGVSGGLQGALELVDISIRQTQEHPFAANEFISAFNIHSAQMLAGLTGSSGVPSAAGSYVATFTYRVQENSAGTFLVDVLYDDVTPIPQERTFLFASPMRKIAVASSSPAFITVGRARSGSQRVN